MLLARGPQALCAHQPLGGLAVDVDRVGVHDEALDHERPDVLDEEAAHLALDVIEDLPLALRTLGRLRCNPTTDSKALQRTVTYTVGVTDAARARGVVEAFVLSPG